MHSISRNIMQSADNARGMNKSSQIKIVKKQEKPDVFIERHEVSLLALLIEKHPERAKEFLRRLGQSIKLAA